MCMYIKHTSIYPYQEYWQHVKQCKNLEKKLTGVNACCFSTVSVKNGAK